jgi:hypothetical protein
MAKRTTVRTFLPWQGGLVDAIDPYLLQEGQLTVADNCLFANAITPTKKKRQGIDFAYDNAVFTVTSRASSGTTRTLTGTFSNLGLIVGDAITITDCSNTAYNGVMLPITAISATDISYTAAATLAEGSTADTTPIWGNSIIGGIDYWPDDGSGNKSQYLMCIYDNGMVVYIEGGLRTRLTDGGTAWTVNNGLEDVSCEVFNNKFIIAVTGSGNKVKYWDGATPASDLEDLPTAPEGSIVRQHQGRLLMNDKTLRDRIHYCTTADHTEWGGLGDSGALDFGIGDGDSVGIVGISPSFKGEIFIGKKSRLFRLSGPIDTGSITLVSDGIGFVSHNAIVNIDQDDLFFVSQRGVHSMQATDTFGSFSSQYVSTSIQTSFLSDIPDSRKKNIKCVYLPNINSVAFAVSDNGTENNSIWLFSIPLKAWYKWPDISCQTLILATDSDTTRMYIGGNNGRLAKAFNGLTSDRDENGVSRSIIFRVATGSIYPDGDPLSIKAFKRVGLIYRPLGRSTVTVTAKIDGFSNQSLSFTSGGENKLLGVDFVLGINTLSGGAPTAPYALPIDGYGRSIKLSVSQSSLTEDVEILGFFIEYVSQQPSQETRATDRA